MRGPSKATQIIVSINCTDSLLRETIIVDFIVLLALNHGRLESPFDAVAEFGALSCSQVTMCLALSLLEVVGGRGQNLSRHVSLLYDPL